MTDLYFFILTAINLFVLIFMCDLVKLSETLNPKQAKGFLVYSDWRNLHSGDDFRAGG